MPRCCICDRSDTCGSLFYSGIEVPFYIVKYRGEDYCNICVNEILRASGIDIDVDENSEKLDIGKMLDAISYGYE